MPMPPPAPGAPPDDSGAKLAAIAKLVAEANDALATYMHASGASPDVVVPPPPTGESATPPAVAAVPPPDDAPAGSATPGSEEPDEEELRRLMGQ